MMLSSLDAIDRRARVVPADVYEAYLARWLEPTRADDPGSASRERKVALAEALAEELWRSGAASGSWEELRRSARLFPSSPEPLPAAPEDLQGVAFFERDGEARYRFAHPSFLAYFLARSLVVSLPVRLREALLVPPLPREVASFMGEALRRRGPPLEAPAVRALQDFLRAPGAASAAEACADEAGCEARANALRLLDGLARWAEDRAAWVPEGADLRGAVLIGEALPGVRLVREGPISRGRISRAPTFRGRILRGRGFARRGLGGRCSRGRSFVGRI
jgi:hypothetical protein